SPTLSALGQEALRTAGQVRPRARRSAYVHPRRGTAAGRTSRRQQSPRKISQILWANHLRSAGSGSKIFLRPRKRERDRMDIETLDQWVRPLEPPGDACGESQRATVRLPTFTVGGQT